MSDQMMLPDLHNPEIDFESGRVPLAPDKGPGSSVNPPACLPIDCAGSFRFSSQPLSFQRGGKI